MNRAIVLDAGPLGMIAHPRPNPEIETWLSQFLNAGTQVILPEITDYEVRRSFLLEGLAESVARLDLLKTTLTYWPIDTSAMRRAAELWARTRRTHQPTAHPQALDADVILAAQAEQADAIVATDNVGHLSHFVEARRWKDITL